MRTSGSSEFAPRDGTLLSSGAEGSVKLWDPASGMLLDEQKLPMGGFVRARWSRDSDWVIAGAGHGKATWSLSGGVHRRSGVWRSRRIRRRRREGRAWGVQPGPPPDPDGKHRSRAEAVGSTTLPLPPRSIWEGKGTGLALGFNADSRRFATADDGVVRVYATAGPTLLRGQPFGSGVFSLSFHPQNPDIFSPPRWGAEPSCGTWLSRAALSRSRDTSAALSFKAPSAPTGTSSRRRQRTTRCGCGRWPSRKPSRPCSAAMPAACSRSASTLRGIGSLSGSSDRTIRIWNIEPALQAIVEGGTAPRSSSDTPLSAGEQSAVAALMGDAEVLAQRNGSKLIWTTSQNDPSCGSRAAGSDRSTWASLAIC